MKSLTILGATGSVGRSTLDLVARNPDDFRIAVLSANTDVAALADLARQYRPELVVIADAAKGGELDAALAGEGIATAAGPDAVIDAAGGIPADLTMAAIVGCAGLAPVMAAIGQGRSVALANKESLVSAGALMTDAAARSGATILPVDSEHNAVFQCLAGSDAGDVRRIILTASGGPFRDWTTAQMQAATPEQAVAHPNWSMGAKISVDSATLMNKGLELIEAFHLFPVAPDQLEAVVHPQSVIHSLVEYRDGSVLAQLGPADMRVPIASALAWPRRMATPCTGLDLVQIGRLDFQAPDFKRFPALAIAMAVLAAGGAKPAILNAANEIAVASFLARRLAFTDIACLVEDVLAACDPPAPTSIGDVLAIDAEARGVASEMAIRMVGKYRV